MTHPGHGDPTCNRLQSPSRDGAPDLPESRPNHDSGSPPPGPAQRSGMVARRLPVPGLPAQLPGHQRRWHRRPAGHQRPPGLPGRAGGGRPLDLPVLHLAHEGFWLRRGRFPRRGSDLRHPGGLRPAGGAGPRPGPAGGHRPGAVAFLGRAPLVPGKPVQPGQCQGRLVRVGRRQAGRDAAQQLAVGVRRLRLGLGTAPAPVLPAQFPRVPAGPQFPCAGGPGADAGSGALLARAGGGRVPLRRLQFPFPRPAAAQQPAGQRPGPAAGHLGEPEQSLRLPAAQVRQEPAGEPGVPAPPAAAAGRARGHEPRRGGR